MTTQNIYQQQTILQKFSRRRNLAPVRTQPSLGQRIGGYHSSKTLINFLEDGQYKISTSRPPLMSHVTRVAEPLDLSAKQAPPVIANTSVKVAARVGRQDIPHRLESEAQTAAAGSVPTHHTNITSPKTSSADQGVQITMEFGWRVLVTLTTEDIAHVHPQKIEPKRLPIPFSHADALTVKPHLHTMATNSPKLWGRMWERYQTMTTEEIQLDNHEQEEAEVVFTDKKIRDWRQGESRIQRIDQWADETFVLMSHSTAGICGAEERGDITGVELERREALCFHPADLAVRDSDLLERVDGSYFNPWVPVSFKLGALRVWGKEAEPKLT